jgi:hypothetical protein
VPGDSGNKISMLGMSNDEMSGTFEDFEAIGDVEPSEMILIPSER